MATSISTPASLATFAQPHASSSKQPHVTLSPVEGEDGSYAVAAVQGDGVWTYDLRNMRPTTSFTVPPNTVFASSPISFVRKPRAKEKGKAQDDGMDVDGDASAIEGRVRYTAVAVEQGEGIEKSARGKVVWTWTGDEGDYTASTLQRRIVGLHRISHPTHPILAIQSATSFSALPLDSSLAARHVTLSETTVVTGDILATQSMTTSTGTPGCIVVDVLGNWALVALEGSDELRPIKQKEGSLTGGNDGKRKFKSASISKDGIITATDDKDRLVSRSIHEAVADSATHPTLLHPPSPPVSLSLPTSGKPLAVLPTAYPTPTILLAIPSATTPALLSSVSVSTASANTYITHLAHLGQTAPNVFIVGVVLHHGSTDETTSGRSVVYTCEVTIPARGIGLNALLGSQAKTEEYFSLSSSSQRQAPNGVSAEDKVVDSLKASLAKGDTKAARAVLEKRLSAKPPTSEKAVKQVVHAIFHTALPALNKDTESESKKRGPYDSQMVALLLQKNLIHDDMLKGGLVASGLLPLADWDNIMVALPAMRTIPSSTLVSLIKASLTTSDSPSVESVLQAILALPAPAPTYRLELKRGLDVEQATSVLQVLVNWSEAWVAQNNKGIKWDVEGDALTGAIQSALPSLEAVITHSSHLLDSHTPLFLAHPPAYPLLERMQAALEPLLLMQADYRALRAPLDAVLTLQRRAERNLEERQKKNLQRSGAYGAQKQKQNSNKADAGAGGAKTMGEAKVGKWKVEDFAF